MKVSPHFTCDEVTATGTGLDNRIPSREVLVNAVHTAVFLLEPVRDRFGKPFSPNSWYRTPTINTIVGGSPKSDHLTGGAVDIEITDVDNLFLAHWIATNLDFDQVILEGHRRGDPSSGWVHVSYRMTGNRNQVMTYKPGTKMWVSGLQELE